MMIHYSEMRTQVLILQPVWRGLKNSILVTSAASGAAADTRCCCFLRWPSWISLQHWNIQESGWEENCRPQRKAFNPTASLERSQKFCFGYFSSCRSCSRHKMLLMFSQVTLLNITITYKYSRTWLRREVQTPEESWSHILEVRQDLINHYI